MERKPRKNTTKLKPEELMKPLKFEDFGTANDPCYGKHYSIAALECKRCGDNDVCAILSQQKMLNEVKQEETVGRWKDVEEGKLIDKQNRMLSKLIAKRAQKKPGKWLKLDKLVPVAREKFNLNPEDDLHLMQRVVKAAQQAENVKLNKSLTSYRYED